MEQNFKKRYWNDAAIAGLILGLFLFGFSIISWLLRLDITMGWVNSLATFGAITACVYFAGRRLSLASGDRGFSYGDGVSFALATMLFAGFISGVGGYLMSNFIAPEYTKEVLSAAIDQAVLNVGQDMDSDQMTEAVGMAGKIMKSALVMIFSHIFNMTIYGCFISLIVSIFLKKEPNHFSEAPKDGK